MSNIGINEVTLYTILTLVKMSAFTETAQVAKTPGF